MTKIIMVISVLIAALLARESSVMGKTNQNAREESKNDRSPNPGLPKS